MKLLKGVLLKTGSYLGSATNGLADYWYYWAGSSFTQAKVKSAN